MNYLTSLIDGATGFNFTIDLNTVMMAFISVLLGIIGWFTRKWGTTIENQIKAIHGDLQTHNDRSVAVHDRLFKAIALDANRISKIEGKLEGRDD